MKKSLYFMLLVFIGSSLLLCGCEERSENSKKNTYLERFLDKYSDTGYCMELTDGYSQRTVIVTDECRIEKQSKDGEPVYDHYAYKDADYVIQHEDKTYAYNNKEGNDWFSFDFYFGQASKLIESNEENGIVTEIWQSEPMKMAGKEIYINSEYTFDKKSGELTSLFIDDGFSSKFDVLSVTVPDESMEELPDLSGYTDEASISDENSKTE